MSIVEENDFGFTAVTSEELGISLKITAPAAPVVDTTSMTKIENLILDLSKKIPDYSRIEQKIDKILTMELNELSAAVTEQGSNLGTVINEIQERVDSEKEQQKFRMKQVEDLIVPLLNNLMKNPEKEYIKWPNRVEKIQSQIQKILEVTRAV
jgi:hypothetical protein